MNNYLRIVKTLVTMMFYTGIVNVVIFCIQDFFEELGLKFLSSGIEPIAQIFMASFLITTVALIVAMYLHLYHRHD